MTEAILGRTGLKVSKDAFGALPIQRADKETAVKILRKALAQGINFFDTARGYTDSEEKLGIALADRRGEFVIATKTHSQNGESMKQDLETSLGKLKTAYIDIYQFHNPKVLPRPGDGSGLYEAALEAKKQGKIRFIGLSNHRLTVAREMLESGLYDTLQFPFNYLSNDEEISLVKHCAEKNVGFIAMKALSGGLITDIFAAQAWMAQFPNVVPIWGIQRENELDALLEAANRSGPLRPEEEQRIAKDRKELGGEFCRGCGYCLPCPAEIQINFAARVNLLMRRSPSAHWHSEEGRKEMARIENCQHCGACASRCPYSLDVPALLEKNYRIYLEDIAKL